MTIGRAIAELLREGLDDWVPLHNVIWESREAASSSGDDFREIVETVVASVIAEGLMVAGDVGATGSRRGPAPNTSSLPGWLTNAVSSTGSR